MKQKFHATNRITASYERVPVKKPRFKSLRTVKREGYSRVTESRLYGRQSLKSA